MQRPTFGRDDTFTLSQFMRYYDLLHEQDEFRVWFFIEVFYYEQCFTPHVLEMVYCHYLKFVCNQALRENNPICLTGEMIDWYGLTVSDVQIVDTQLQEYNTNLMEDIQLEYNALSNLDGIKK